MMNPKSIAEMIMKKKMAKGGMCMADGGEVEGSLDDFLSDEEDDSNMLMALDKDEQPKIENSMDRKSLIRKIMSRGLSK